MNDLFEGDSVAEQFAQLMKLEYYKWISHNYVTSILEEDNDIYPDIKHVVR
jgi:hypothetical protein